MLAALLAVSRHEKRASTKSRPTLPRRECFFIGLLQVFAGCGQRCRQVHGLLITCITGLNAKKPATTRYRGQAGSEKHCTEKLKSGNRESGNGVASLFGLSLLVSDRFR